VELLHHAKSAARLRILVCGRHPFPTQTLNPPVASIAHLIAVTEVYGDLVDAAQMKNEKGLEDWSRIDARDADGVAQLNAKA
jgi:ureidoglycolate hydrolase